MLGTLPWDSKAKWQQWVSTMTHAYNCSLSHVTGFSLYFLMLRRKLRIPIDKEFGVTFPCSENPMIYGNYVDKLQQKLEWAYKVAQEHIEKDAARQKLYYDRRFQAMEIIPGDLVLVHQKVFGPTHKIEDRWEHPVYWVIRKFGDGPVYRVQKLGEPGQKEMRDLHRNMLFPFLHMVGEENDNIEAVEGDMVPEAVDDEADLMMQALMKANAFMDVYFDVDVLLWSEPTIESEMIQDFGGRA